MALRQALAMLALSAAPAAAQTFHIKEADFEVGKWTFESVNAAQQGFSANTERIRSGHELGLGYAVTAGWQLKGLVSFDSFDHETTRLQRAMIENIVVLRALGEEQDGIGLAWFQSVESALVARETNLTLFGPSILLRSGKYELALNPFLEKSFGQNHTDGIDLVYGWQARRELSSKVSLGIEGYGRIADLGSGQPVAEQEHRIGPVLILKSVFGSAPASAGPSASGHSASPANAELELGALFGVTEATPDMTIKANLHLNF